MDEISGENVSDVQDDFIIIYNEWPTEKNNNQDFVDNDEDDYKNLPTLEEAVEDFRAGCEDAFEYIYHRYDHALNYVKMRYNDEDLGQELRLVLYRCVKTYQFGGSAKFNTYFWKCARNHIGVFYIRKKAKKRTSEFGTISMQQTVFDNNNITELGDTIEDKSEVYDLDNCLFGTILKTNIYPNLCQKDIMAIEMLLAGNTLSEIGMKLHMSTPAIHARFRKLKDKKIIGKQLEELKNAYM